MHLIVLGLNHKTAPLSVRERVHIASENLPAALKALNKVVPEGVIFSTCNRFEVLAQVANPDQGKDKLIQFISEQCRIPRGEFENVLYCHTGQDALQHVFRVAASLDSMVVGEAQILGQMKQSFVLADRMGTIQAVLHSVMERAFSVAKKIRTNTLLATYPVSISSVAVDLASTIFGDLGNRTALIIGAGKMSMLAIQHLRSHGISELIVTNRTLERAIEIALQIEGRAVPFEEHLQWLAKADIVISSTGCPQLILGKEEIQKAMTIRKNRPLFLIDIAVPRDIDPDAHKIPNVFVYDMDNLQDVAARNSAKRAKEAVKAEEIVNREATLHWKKLMALDVSPTIQEIQQRVEDLCKDELEDGFRRLGDIPEEQKLALERLATGLVNKIVQGPFIELRHLAAEPDSGDKIRFVRSLFLA